MTRHCKTLTKLISALTLASLPLQAAGQTPAPTDPAAGIAALRDKPGRIGKLDTSLRNSNTGTLRMVTSKARRTTQCIGADLGHFAILTSYDCLADWWNDKASVSVGYSAYDYKTSSGYFVRAFRGGLESRDRWAVLETAGHSGGYFGYRDLDSDKDLDRTVFTFVGLSSRVKGGKEPAMQSGCHLRRNGPDTYVSDCGGDFSETGFLILRPGDPGKPGPYVSGLARVAGTSKIAKRQIYTLGITTMRFFGPTLGQLREDQANRYQALVDQRREAARRNAENRDHPDEFRHTPRRAGPSAAQILLEGLQQIADTVSNKTPLYPPASTPTTTRAQTPAQSASQSEGCSGFSARTSLPREQSEVSAGGRHLWLRLPAAGGHFTVFVDSPPTCNWTAARPNVHSASGQIFATFALPPGGGSGQFPVMVQPNGDDAREIVIGFNGAFTIQLLQCGRLHDTPVSAPGDRFNGCTVGSR